MQAQQAEVTSTVLRTQDQNSCNQWRPGHNRGSHPAMSAVVHILQSRTKPLNRRVLRDRGIDLSATRLAFSRRSALPYSVSFGRRLHDNAEISCGCNLDAYNAPNEFLQPF